MGKMTQNQFFFAAKAKLTGVAFAISDGTEKAAKGRRYWISFVDAARKKHQYFGDTWEEIMDQIDKGLEEAAKIAAETAKAAAGAEEQS